MPTAILAAALLVACHSGSGPPVGSASEDRSVVLVSVEALRADVLQIYGGEIEAPALASVAGEGVRFVDAVSVAPMARPAVATLLTGLAPDRTGVRDNHADVLPQRVSTLAEVHGRRGRTTAAFVGSPFVSYASGLDRGFDVFDGPEDIGVGPGSHYPTLVPGSELADHFATWLSGIPTSETFFAWLHLSDIHGAATLPDIPEREPEPVVVYAERVRQVDAALTRILEALQASGRAGATEIWIVGTHGVLLGEDGARGDMFWLRPETLRVPLIVAGVDGLDVERPVWLPDVAVSLGAPRQGSDGIDLRQPATAGDRPRRAWTWAPDDQLAWSPRVAIERGGAWDPLDRRAAERPARPRDRSLAAETVQKVEAAGFRVGGGTPPEEPGPGAARNLLLSKLARMRQWIAMDRPRAALRVSRTLTDAHPDNLALLAHRVWVLDIYGEDERSAELGGRLLALYPERAESYHLPAHRLMAQGELEKAELLLLAATEIGPADPDLSYDLACVSSRLGDIDGAARRLREAIEAGYRDWSWIERDSDLANLRADPRFSKVLASYGR